LAESQGEVDRSACCRHLDWAPPGSILRRWHCSRSLRPMSPVLSVWLESSTSPTSRQHKLAWRKSSEAVRRSRELHEEELREATDMRNERVRARALAQLGVIAVDEGRIADAFPLLEEAYRIDRELGERVETAIDVARLARAVAHAGRVETAARVLSAAEAYRREIGATFRPWARTMNEETLEMIRARLDDTSFDATWEAGASLAPDEAVALALRNSTHDAS
jgi:hypothetical protein